MPRIFLYLMQLFDFFRRLNNKKVNETNKMRKIVFKITAVMAVVMMEITAQAQTNQTTQTIRGQVTDVASGNP